MSGRPSASSQIWAPGLRSWRRAGLGGSAEPGSFSKPVHLLVGRIHVFLLAVGHRCLSVPSTRFFLSLGLFITEQLAASERATERVRGRKVVAAMSLVT